MPEGNPTPVPPAVDSSGGLPLSRVHVHRRLTRRNGAAHRGRVELWRFGDVERQPRHACLRGRRQLCRRADGDGRERPGHVAVEDDCGRGPGRPHGRDDGVLHLSGLQLRRRVDRRQRRHLLLVVDVRRWVPGGVGSWRRSLRVRDRWQLHGCADGHQSERFVRLCEHDGNGRGAERGAGRGIRRVVCGSPPAASPTAARTPTAPLPRGPGASAAGTASGAAPAFAFAAPGTYPVTLTVTDDDGATVAPSRCRSRSSAACTRPTAAPR